MNKSKLQLFVTIGALMGGVATSWLAPKAIAWYFDPPVNIGVNCREATEWSMLNLQKAQLTGVVVGAIIGLILSFLVSRKSKGSIPASMD